MGIRSEKYPVLLPVLKTLLSRQRRGKFLLIKLAHILAHSFGFVVCITLISVSSVVKSRFTVHTRPSEKRNYFCTDCHLEVQNSTKHCNKCGICVDNFDHHCVWLNQCIGRRNYWLFISTVIVCLAFVVYSLTYSIGVCLMANRYVDDDRSVLAVVSYQKEYDRKQPTGVADR